MILILSDKSDAHYQYMQQRLVDRGEEVLLSILLNFHTISLLDTISLISV